MNQDEVFLQSEGDRWLARNKAAILNAEFSTNDHVIRTMTMMNLAPQCVLEIGASNGWRLHEIARRFGCRVTAVEPSREAIQDGQGRFPSVQFLRGTASELPCDGQARFDLVIINFVFHWVDRSTLLRSVAEIDRVLSDGGFLLIGDFYPSLPQRVRYHHLPDQDVWTYKQNYGDIFLSSNLYEMIASYSFDHATHALRSDVAPEDRAQVALLRKCLGGRYQSASPPKSSKL
jgi:SAM-dependent methyltransferase